MAKIDDLKYDLQQYEDSIRILRNRSGHTPIPFSVSGIGYSGTETNSNIVPSGAVEGVIRDSGWFDQVSLLKKQIKEIEEAAPVFTYNYSSIYGTFTTQANTEPEAYQMFSLWLREKESQVTPEPQPEPTPEPIPEPPPTPTPEPTPEQKITYWVKRPSGIIEQLTVSQNFVNQMTAQGWIFSSTPFVEEMPQNQNISVVFYTGTGGDLKNYFGISSIVITPDESTNLGQWIYSNYGSQIILVNNRLTNDVRTHTLQQIKQLIVQKIQDDQPPPPTPTPTPPGARPAKAGFMGAGAVGAIAGLVLLGFIVDHKVGK